MNRPKNVKRVQKEPVGESMTRQSESSSADINRIVARGIELPDPNQLHFNDFSDGADFQSVQDSIVRAKASFDALPAKIRSKFRNSPAELVDFMADSENAAEAAKLGLIKPFKEKTGEGSSGSSGDPEPGKTALKNDEKVANPKEPDAN